MQSNAEYKKRLITAMLDGPTFHIRSRPEASGAGRWTPKLIFGVAGLALLSAFGVFLTLYQRDISSNTIRTLVEQPRIVAATIPASSKLPSSVAEPPATNLPQFEFKLKRSRALQTVGPLQMRLLRVNTKRRTCDVSIRLNDRRVIQRRLQLNKPSQVRPPSSDIAMQLSISAIDRDSVSGTLSSVPAVNKD